MGHKRLAVILVGPAGSGKSTQAQWLVSRHGFALVETGALLRVAAESDQLLATTIDRGGLADAVLTCRLVGQCIESIGSGRSLVVDGFIRRTTQVLYLIETLAEEGFGRDDVCVIHFNTQASVCVSRLMTRGRNDDTPPSIQQRIEVGARNLRTFMRLLIESKLRPYILVLDGARGADSISKEITNFLSAM